MSELITSAKPITAVDPAPDFTEESLRFEPGMNDLSLHGIIAGTFDYLGCEGVIDTYVGKRSPKMKINYGAMIKAMVMQLLSSPYQSLYRTGEYFARIPLAALLNKGVEAEELNRFALSRMLDDIADFGPKRLFIKTASEACRRLGVKIEEVHIDSTSYHCDCDEKEDDVGTVHIKYGYSRDHRPDLPQVIQLGLVDGNTKLPIYSDAISGDVADKTSFFDLVARDWPSLAREFKDLKYLTGDSALCTAAIMAEARKNGMHVVTRVPDHFNLSKECFAQGRSAKLEEINPEEPNGSTGLWCGIREIGGVPVRLLLINNENMRSSKTKTMLRRAQKQLEKINKELTELETNPAACRADAEKNLARVEKACRKSFCRIEHVEYKEVMKYPGRGRPRKDAAKQVVGVKVIASASIDEEALNKAVTEELRYVIATTDTSRRWTMGELLSVYHRQSTIERMWRISKNPNVLLNAIYLKKPGRITALLWVLAIALLIFAATEYKLRQAADERGIRELDLIAEQKKQRAHFGRQPQKKGQQQEPAAAAAPKKGGKKPQYKLTLLRFKQYVQNCRISLYIDRQGSVRIVGMTEAFKELVGSMGEAWQYYYSDTAYRLDRMRSLFEGSHQQRERGPTNGDR